MNTKTDIKYSTLGKMALATGLAVLGLAACSSTGAGPTWSPVQNKITVAETVERLELYGGPGGLQLSARDRDAFGNFIAQYANLGQGPLYINVPRNRSAQKGARQARTAIQAQLRAMGLSGAKIQTGQYATPPGAPAPVIVSFRRLAIAPINCQQGSNLAYTSQNRAYKGFGCAQTANLAAMIDNPRQLLSPYAVSGSPAQHSTKMLEKFYDRKATATPRPEGQEISAKDSGG